MPNHSPVDSLWPQISVIVPVFNREALLRSCLESVSSQTWSAWECIVVDDGSTDASFAVAESFAARDSRFKALSCGSTRKGAASARNQGLRCAIGAYIMFLDSDDVLSPGCLASRVDAVSQHRDLDLVAFPVGTFIDRVGDRRMLHNIDKAGPDLLRFLRLDNPWPINGPLWRHDSLVSIGGFDETLPGWQDWQLHVTALLADQRSLKIVGEPDSFIRVKGSDHIGHAAWTLEHVRPKTTFVLNLLNLHRMKLQADSELRSAAAGLVWHLIVRLQELGFRKEAEAHWTCLRDWKYISLRIWFEGLLALRFHGHPGGGICWSFVARWPKTLVGSVDTSTMMSVSY